MKKPRIALVKQNIYDDLYVSSSNSSASTALFSSCGRVGPIGLKSIWGAEFIIVEEDFSSECQLYRKVNPFIADKVVALKNQTIDKMPGLEFRRPGTEETHARYAVKADSVDWSQYDIVISINISVPSRIVKEYSSTLWCYMIGEARMQRYRDPYGIIPRFGYDAVLNQCARGRKKGSWGVLDFPYTFLKSDTLNKILEGRHGNLTKEGIYVEINSCPERPVQSRPDSFSALDDLGMTYHLHEQVIGDNLHNLYKAKYFLKLGGRFIRGNSVAEAISCGTLVLMDPSEVFHAELLTDETTVQSADEARALIEKLENDQELYQALLEQQQENLDYYMYQCPAESLIHAWKKKFQ